MDRKRPETRSFALIQAQEQEWGKTGSSLITDQGDDITAEG
jgi:hypothetical protein